MPVALRGTCAVRTSALPQVKSREASALRASRPPSELGVSLVHILTACTSAVWGSHPTLTRLLPPPKDLGVSTHPFSDCSLLPICKTLPGINDQTPVHIENSPVAACLFQVDFIPAFEKKTFSVVKSRSWGHQAWVAILLTYRPVVGLRQVMTLGFSSSNSKIRIIATASWFYCGD